MSEILVIDDDELHLMLMHNLLESEGYTVLSTADGPQGIAVYKEHRPMLVLLDQGLPSVSGLEVLKEIRKFDDAAKVIVLTGYGGAESVSLAMRYGACGYVEKSVPIKVLLEKIKSALGPDAV